MEQQQQQPQQQPRATIAKASKNDPLYMAAFTKGLIQKYVEKPDTFVKAMPMLSKNPYAKVDAGEKAMFILESRQKLHSACLPHIVLPNQELRVYHLAAWALFQQNNDKLYLPAAKVFAYCAKHKLDHLQLFRHLKKHPQRSVMYTFIDYHDDQIAIGDMLAEARAPAAPIPIARCMELDEVQNMAVAHLLHSGYGALQGGAGVGKTTTVTHLVRTLNRAGVNTVLLAFTHKAKRCMLAKLEAANLNVGAQTIHSFIATFGKTNGDAQPTQLPRSFFLIDEASMTDVPLLGQFARAVMQCCASRGFQLAVVGDEMQLPPVGRGEFFRELVTGGHHVNRLMKCYRTDLPDLFAAYGAIRGGQLPSSSDNVNIVLVEDDAAVNATMGKMIQKHSVDMLAGRTQMIAWQNKDVFKLNKWTQTTLQKANLIGPDTWSGFYKGDRIVYIGDTTADGITNAMTGTVQSAARGGVKVMWENRQVTRVSEAGTICLAYCITVHKSQGSEYSTVIVACYDAAKMCSCLDRRWLYTAITRAKYRVSVVATTQIKEFVAMDVRPIQPTAIKYS